MNTALIYILMALPSGQWKGAVELHETTTPHRCEMMAAQLNETATRTRYVCGTILGKALTLVPVHR